MENFCEFTETATVRDHAQHSVEMKHRHCDVFDVPRHVNNLRSNKNNSTTFYE